MTDLRPTSLNALPRIEDRLSFLFVEHCTIGRDENAVTFTDEDGQTAVPVASLAVLILGPGTRITHAAVSLCGENGCGIIWTGTDFSPVYAYGAPLSGSTLMLQKQAEIVSSERKRLEAARRMYSVRFPNEDTSGLVMKQLLGREGTRMQRFYVETAKAYGFEWRGRHYRENDPVNRALDTANHIYYGLVQTAIVGLGCSPALGIVHTGTPTSFVYDIADMRKTEITIPLAFKVAAEHPEEIRLYIRRELREILRTSKALKQCVEDIKYTLDMDTPPETNMRIWAGQTGMLEAGLSLRGQGFKI